MIEDVRISKLHDLSGQWLVSMWRGKQIEKLYFRTRAAALKVLRQITREMGDEPED